jgi:hypothetical protein
MLICTLVLRIQWWEKTIWKGIYGRSRWQGEEMTTTKDKEGTGKVVVGDKVQTEWVLGVMVAQVTLVVMVAQVIQVASKIWEEEGRIQIRVRVRVQALISKTSREDQTKEWATSSKISLLVQEGKINLGQGQDKG